MIVDYGLATTIEECPYEKFWVVILSDGTQVFQSEPDAKFNQPNPWVRLKQYCQDKKLHVAGMAYANKAYDQSQQINLSHLADGYFYSKRVRKMLTYHPAYTGFQDNAEGVGEVFGDKLIIKWIHPDGRIEDEIREIKGSEANGSLSIIMK